MADDHTGSIIGYLPADPEDLTVEGGEPATELHVTMLFLTDDHTTIGEAQRAAIQTVMDGMASGPIEATVSGVQPLGSDDPQATVLMLDSPELQQARVDLKAALTDAGVSLPEDTYPEFLPHITVGYGTNPLLSEGHIGETITLDRMAAFYGPDRVVTSLTAAATGGAPVAETFTAVIGQLGIPTGDGRIIDPRGFSTRALPLPLQWQESTGEGHEDAVTVGVIESITPDYLTGNVLATGHFLDPAVIDEIPTVLELVRSGVVYPSMDAGLCEVDYMETAGGYDGEGYPMSGKCLMMLTRYECAGATLVSVPAFANVSITLGTGETSAVNPNPTTGPGMPGTPVEPGMPAAVTAAVLSPGSLPIADTGTAWDGSGAAKRVATWAGVDKDNAPASAWTKYAKAFLWQDPSMPKDRITSYKLGIADVINGKLTIVPKAVYSVAGVLNGARGGTDIPQADQKRIKSAVSGLYRKIAKAADDPSIVAPFALTACAQERPPAEWFAAPSFDGPTPITVTDDGRVYGHIGLHGERHRGFSGNVQIPKSQSGYASFLLGYTVTAEGTNVPVGKITLGGGHADTALGMQAAVDHYDDVSTTVAVVNAGDDQYGVWVAGAIKGNITDDQIDTLRESPPSGDWRTDSFGNLELIGVHAVNVPGFAVPRFRVGEDGQRRFALIASSAMVTREVIESARRVEFTIDVAGDLAAQFEAAGLEWPTISMSIGGRQYGPVPVAEGCVRSMLGGDAVVAAVPQPTQPAEWHAERARAKARLALARKGR